MKGHLEAETKWLLDGDAMEAIKGITHDYYHFISSIQSVSEKNRVCWETRLRLCRFSIQIK